MYRLTNFRKASIAFAVAIGIIASIGFFQSIARADISNPHPVPPTNSVTNAMLVSTAVQDNVVSTGANINPEKLNGSGTIGSLFISDGVGGEISNLATLSTSTNQFSVTASTSLMATTSIAATSANRLCLNTQCYSFPASKGTTGQVFTTDGNNNISLAPAGPVEVALTNQVGQSQNTRQYITSAYIPIGIITASSTITVTSYWTNNGTSGTCNTEMDWGSGVSTTSIGTAALSATPTSYGSIQSTLFANSSSNELYQSVGYGSGTTLNQGSVSMNNSKVDGFDFYSTSAGGSSNCAFNGVTIIVYP